MRAQRPARREGVGGKAFEGASVCASLGKLPACHGQRLLPGNMTVPEVGLFRPLGNSLSCGTLARRDRGTRTRVCRPRLVSEQSCAEVAEPAGHSHRPSSLQAE